MTLPESSRPSGPIRTAFTRRSLLGATAGGVLGGYALRSAAGPDGTEGRESAIPLWGRHQKGIATPPQEHLLLAAFDLDADDASSLRDLLIDWTRVAEDLVLPRNAAKLGRGLVDNTREADELGANSLTLTFGVGPAIFQRDGEDRMGLARLRPPQLDDLPYFIGDALIEQQSGGDLCVQACADSAQATFHAIHALTRAAAGTASPRWTQAGFRGSQTRGEPDPRNLMGFKDGTVNVDCTDEKAMRRSVWAHGGDSPRWMADGSYLVVRRVQILLDSWDALSEGAQEMAVGRSKVSGAPLGSASRTDRARLDAHHGGQPVIPEDAHIRLASPHAGDGPPPLRRSYSFVDGVGPGSGQLDAGLLFLSFQRDPTAQFVPIQRRLATNDALSSHLQHTASAVFACLPGIRRGSYVGDRLFAQIGRG